MRNIAVLAHDGPCFLAVVARIGTEILVLPPSRPPHPGGEDILHLRKEYYAEGLYHDPVTSSAGTEVFLSLPEPPTCIFYPDDYAALGGIRELNSHGLTPGKDISIVGYDGIALTSMMIPPLTTYEQNGETIGRTMAEALLAKIENPAEFEPKKEMVTGRLIKGGTVVKL